MDEIDTLSNLIRVMDPEHKMGAGALAEVIVNSGWMSDHDREVRAQAYENLAKDPHHGWAIATSLIDMAAVERGEMTQTEMDEKWGIER